MWQGAVSDDVCARCEADVDVDSISVCIDVPSGTTAPSSGTTVSTLSLEKGYYRTSDTSLAILECYQEEACVGGSDAEHMCASGYEGPCEFLNGFTEEGGECLYRGRSHEILFFYAIELLYSES